MHTISKKQGGTINKIKDAGSRMQDTGYWMPDKICSMLNGESIVPGFGSRIKGMMFLMVALGSLCLSSCSSSKTAAIYFKGIKNDTTLNNVISKDLETKIQTGDLLGITVSSLSPENTALYNAPQDAEGNVTGFLVDSVGNINFFKLGAVHAAGLTRSELKEELEKKLVPYLAQTVVAVGFLNRHVTLIGAVSPSILPMSTDHMTIFDALASAGDISEKGKKDDVLVIREEGSARVFKKLDLTDETIFYSPYFYLKPNDIIYVKPEEKKQKISTTQVISYVTTGISLYLLIFTRLIK